MMGCRTVTIYNCDWCHAESNTINSWFETYEDKKNVLLCSRCMERYNNGLAFAKKSDISADKAISEFHRIGREEGIIEAAGLFTDPAIPDNGQIYSKIMKLMEKKT